MTTEADFQAVLDANPRDWQTRLVFADWLEERGDPRAEGYRALGHLRRCPRQSPTVPYENWYWSDTEIGEGAATYAIGRAWMVKLAGGSKWYWPRESLPFTRREAEDAAALAFLRLSAEQRAEIVSSSPQS